VTLDFRKSALYQAIKIARCWKGYEPVPGMKAYEPGSCRPKGSKPDKKKKEVSSKAANYLIKLAIDTAQYGSPGPAARQQASVRDPRSLSYLAEPGFGNWIYSMGGAIRHSIPGIGGYPHKSFYDPRTTSLNHMDPETRRIRDLRNSYNRFWAGLGYTSSNTELEQQRAMDYIQAARLGAIPRTAIFEAGEARPLQDPNFISAAKTTHSAPVAPRPAPIAAGSPPATSNVTPNASTTAQPAPTAQPTSSRPAAPVDNSPVRFRAADGMGVEEALNNVRRSHSRN
jgi:hypothetical protein